MSMTPWDFSDMTDEELEAAIARADEGSPYATATEEEYDRRARERHFEDETESLLMGNDPCECQDCGGGLDDLDQYIAERGLRVHERGDPPCTSPICDKLDLHPCETEGTKHDDGKPMMDLIDPWFELDLSKAMTIGCKTHGAYNYEKLDECRLIASLNRHRNAYERGEYIDPDSGLPHLALIAANAMMLHRIHRKRGTTTPTDRK